MGVSPRMVASVRVSTDKQVEHGLSLEAQQAKLTAYATLYELDLVTVEVDAGVSAKTLQRPALQQALGALKAVKAEVAYMAKRLDLARVRVAAQRSSFSSPPATSTPPAFQRPASVSVRLTRSVSARPVGW